MQVEARLKEMGVKLPPAVTPVANYVPSVRTGNLVFLSGHGPFNEDGSLITGKVGSELTTGLRGWPPRASSPRAPQAI